MDNIPVWDGPVDARGRYKEGGCVRPGKVTAEIMNEWLQREDADLRGGGLDKAPRCYKRQPQVLAQHWGAIKIRHTLRPLGVAMASINKFERYRD